MSISDVLILAGGRGSRLKSVTGNNPKCLVQVIKNKLFIEYVLENGDTIITTIGQLNFFKSSNYIVTFKT